MDLGIKIFYSCQILMLDKIYYNIHVLCLDTTTKNILYMLTYTRNMNMYISIKTRLGDATVTN